MRRHPDWTSDQWQPLREWISHRDSKVDLAIDTYGEGLRWFVKQSPDIVKINRDELVTLFDEDVSANDALHFWSKLLSHINQEPGL